MDIEKIMVLVKGEDKTDSIIDIALDVSSKKIQVTYSGGRSYFYNLDNVVILENPKSLSEEQDGILLFYLADSNTLIHKCPRRESPGGTTTCEENSPAQDSVASNSFRM